MAARGLLRVLGAMSMAFGLGNCLASTDTITWGNDNSRTGYQPNKNMDPAVVASSDFGQLFSVTLPGNYGGVPEQFFSMPLVYTPGNDEYGRQFLYLATTQNNVYKLDAKTGEILASRNLGIPFLSRDLNTTDLGYCYDITPHVGIIGTGVIDPASETLYLAAKTYVDQTQINVPQGRPSGRWNIHALSVNDLSERPNFPINFEGQDARNNIGRPFNGGMHNQRPALLHPGQGQFIYAAFGSHCVLYNFTGRIIGFDKDSGKIVEHWATEGQDVPSPTKGGGIWMSGGGLASDDKGSMFFATGNGYASQLHDIPVNGRNPPTALEEAVVHHIIMDNGTLNIVDFFMPEEKEQLDGADQDLGTSPFELLPSQFSCGSISRIGVVTGKSGWTYFLNMDDLGGYRTNNPPQPAGLRDRVVGKFFNPNSVYAGAGVYPLEGGYIYIPVINFPTSVLKFSCANGVPSFTKVGQTPESNAGILGISHGTVTSLNGQPGTGLLWTTDVRPGSTSGFSIKVHEAVPGPDGNLKLIKGFNVNNIRKFTRAVLGNGILYVPSDGTITAFGAPTVPALNCTGAGSFGNMNIGVDAPVKTISCTAKIGLTVNTVSLNSTEYALDGVPALPETMNAGDVFQFNVHFKPTMVGNSTGTAMIRTTNNNGGYSRTTPVRVSGSADSPGPLLSIQPSSLSFNEVPLGSGGTSQSIVVSNMGEAGLTVQSIQYSEVGPNGPFIAPNASDYGASQVGLFTFANFPTSLGASSSQVGSVSFNPTASGNFTMYAVITTDGGSGSVRVDASCGAPPVAVLQFQTPDGSGWVTWTKGSSLSFGNVTENTERGLKLRLVNGAPAGAVPLRVTISKPPFGSGSIISTRSATELAEGTTLQANQSADANVFCAVPKAQWNTDSYVRGVAWTFNFNDFTLGKVNVPFDCTAVSQQGGPLRSDGQGVYRYVGCFKENNPGRQLAQLVTANDNMTSAACINACAAKGYAYCGAQYHRECWGGPNPPVLQVDEGNCNYDCAGDISQLCGGNGVGAQAGNAFISLWATNTTLPPPTAAPGGPYVNPGLNGYNSIGCYTEATQGRALPNGYTGSVETVAACINTCGPKSYKFIGLQYGGECWCGNSLDSPGVVPAPISQCNMVCRDNSTEYCGAGSRNLVYQLNNTGPAQTASGTGTASSTTATGTATSALPTTTTTPVIPTGSPYIRSTIGTYRYMGCYTENTGTGRSLADKSYFDDLMTLDKCVAQCAGYTYGGIEYGRECYCGNQLRGTTAQDNSTGVCNFLCPGDKTEWCGSGNRLSLFQFDPSLNVTSTSTSSSSTSATSTSSSSSSGTGASLTGASITSSASVTSSSSSSSAVSSSSSSTSSSINSSSSTSSTSSINSSSSTSSTSSGSSSASASATGSSTSASSTSTSTPDPSSAAWSSTSSASSTSSDVSSASTVSSTSTTSTAASSTDSSSAASSTTSSASSTSSDISSAWTDSSTSASSTSTSTTDPGSVSTTDSSTSISSTTTSSASTSDNASSTSTAGSASTSSTSSASNSDSSWSASSTSSDTLSASGTASAASATSTDSSTSASSTSASTTDSSSVSTTESSTSASTSASTSSGSSTASGTSTTTSSTAFETSTSSSAPVSSTSSTTSDSSSSTSSSSSSLSTSSTADPASTTSSTTSSLTATATSSSSSSSTSSSWGPSTTGMSTGSFSSSSTITTITSSSASGPSTTSSSSSVSSSTSTSTSSSTSSSTGVATSSSWSSASTSTSAGSSSSSSSVPSTTSSTVPSTSSSSTSSTSSVASSTSTTSSLSSGSTSSSTSRSSTSTSTTSTLPSSTVAPPLWPGNVNFTYFGCVSEPSSGRIFAKQVVNLANMTQDQCLQACWMYKYAGIEYGRECWCGNTINYAGNVGATPGANVSDSQCSFNCPGNSTTKCGAGLRLTTFYLDPAKKAASQNKTA